MIRKCVSEFKLLGRNVKVPGTGPVEEKPNAYSVAREPLGVGQAGMLIHVNSLDFVCRTPYSVLKLERPFARIWYR